MPTDFQNKLQTIFNADYPGVDTFISDVIVPIFGDNIDRKDVEILDKSDYRQAAERAHIIRMHYIADIENINSNNICLYDVTLDDNANIRQSRVAIQQLIRRISFPFSHILMVFHYASPTNKAWRFSYAYKESTISGMETAKRFTYIFGKEYRSRTASERFEVLRKSDKKDTDFRAAFSVQTLSDEFFYLYRAYYAMFVEFITGKRYSDEKELLKYTEKEWKGWKQFDKSNQFNTSFAGDFKTVRDYIKKMFGRILFLYFLQRKGWLAGNRRYMYDLYASSDKKDNFLDGVLEPLFFEVLNTDKTLRKKTAKDLPGNENIPYLNGGLFAEDEEDRAKCVFPAEYFGKFFEFLDGYNFTIDENDPDDAEIGVDPEMLGRIFENLLEDNKDKGAFYTPKEIVDYMCRESIIAYLQNEQFSQEGNDKIRAFVESYDGENLSKEQRTYLRDKLKAVKICDPAIGSGAFPMGMVNLLSKLYVVLKINTDFAVVKRHIMEQNIYGVDIEKGAVDIARLRFWLAMIVEEKEPIPLPNLHFKIMQGNSLLEYYKGTDLSDLTKLSAELKRGESRGLWDKDTKREDLIQQLKSYYATSDHTKRSRTFNNIIDNVRDQLSDKGVVLPQNTDPSANTDFFLWHTWFSDVFKQGGFDIVIGNPPYISALEAKKVICAELRNNYKLLYKSAQGAYDLYIIFIELGLTKLNENGVLSYITPSKYLSAEYAESLREVILNTANIRQFVDYSHVRVFKNAGVSTMISLFSKQKQGSMIQCKRYKDLNNPASQHTHPYTLLTWLPSNVWGFLLSDSIDILKSVIEKSILLNTICSINACSTAGEADIFENALREESDNGLKYINNGTFNRYTSYWGITPIRKKKLLCPYLPLSKNVISERRKNMFLTPKLIFAKIGSRPQVFFDSIGEYASANTNMVYDVRNYDYYALVAWFNSDLFNYIYRKMFGGLTMLGSIQIQAPQIRKFYIPKPELVPNKLCELAKQICIAKETDCNANTLNYEKDVEMILSKIFQLSYDSVIKINPETPITREEYENFNLENFTKK